MRQAMFKAGLIYSPDSDRLDFCAEPMAGLLYEMVSSKSHTPIQKGDPVLIVDMGGGTVDLTAMRMSGTGFEELVPGLGASCGSTILDDAFLAMFRDAIGTNKLFQAPDGLRVKGVFSPVIRKGQALTPGIVATKKYRAESFTDTIIRASWFVSKLESPIFTDTSDCKCIGVLEVQVTPSQDYANRDTVEVTISMSPSGLMFHAKSLSTNKPVDCRIEFHD
ncbi:hypothetical protein AMAG_12990 [Allomyces macrogynus ATCC 38327]|uniref:Uncharacterized protein n=1 Tax=Allomyces macrogynus (strain ATCC 38327) TaxID=578462 RepID=A0A0L0T0Z7_ALLM3|nr:hypothetical protein AMAG_12990 [Allomyces macrogynus ATCC 38327]|eukprot:KNE68330.1 hypothetical protein AMAG_12990 [Allomyces macrogynus ATCC 38327]